jgi:hypothetical protein
VDELLNHASSIVRLLTFKEANLSVRQGALVLLTHLLKDHKVQDLVIKDKLALGISIALFDTAKEAIIVKSSDMLYTLLTLSTAANKSKFEM